MKLTILGNNGPYPSIGGATSGYLLNVNNKNFVLDFGSGVLANLQKHIDISNIDAIVLSHVHFDHISDLGVLAYYCQVNKIKKIKLYTPQINDYINMVLKTGFFDCEVYEQGEVDLVGERVVFNKMNHPVLSYSISFTENGKVFSYSGDTNICDNLISLFKKSDYLLCDTAFLKETWLERLPHLNVYDACKLAQDNACKVILSHLNPKTTQEELQNEAFGDYIISKINDTIEI